VIDPRDGVRQALIFKNEYPAACCSVRRRRLTEEMERNIEKGG